MKPIRWQRDESRTGIGDACGCACHEDPETYADDLEPCDRAGCKGCRCPDCRHRIADCEHVA